MAFSKEEHYTDFTFTADGSTVVFEVKREKTASACLWAAESQCLKYVFRAENGATPVKKIVVFGLANLDDAVQDTLDFFNKWISGVTWRYIQAQPKDRAAFEAAVDAKEQELAAAAAGGQ